MFWWGVLEDHLKTKTSINRHVIFSDGCAAQFKFKIPSAALSMITRKATAVASDRYSISCASDLYNFFQAELVKEVNCVENRHKGSFFLLLEDIEHRDKPTILIAIKNTRSLHAIRHCNLQGAELEYKLVMFLYKMPVQRRVWRTDQRLWRTDQRLWRTYQRFVKPWRK